VEQRMRSTISDDDDDDEDEEAMGARGMVYGWRGGWR